MLLKDRDADLARLQAKAEKAAAQSGRNSAGAKGGKKTPTKSASAKKVFYRTVVLENRCTILGSHSLNTIK